MKFLPNTLRCHDQEETFLSAIGRADVIEFTDPQPEDRNNPRVEPIVVSTTEDPTRPILREIRRFVRSRQDDKEYVFFLEYLKGETFRGKATDKHRWVGKYDEPQGQRDREPTTGKYTYTGEGEKVTKYEIPFSRSEFVDPSTGEKTTLDDLPRGREVMYYVKSNNKLYRVPEVNYEDYINTSIEYLVEWSKTGKRPAPKLEEPIVARGKRNTLTVKAEAE